MASEPVLRVQTPAKINPVLDILEKRPDGFHELFMHMVPVSFYDELSLSPAPELVLDVEGADFQGPVEDNLVFRAAQRFGERSGQPVNWHLRLHKRIPSGAGLGGGSSDAAATLRALNRLHQQVLPEAVLQELALELGADVPFFLDPRPCVAQGRGERLTPLPHYPEAEVLLITPPFPIATGPAYRECQPLRLPAPPVPSTLAELAQGLRNRFEVTLLDAYPALRTLKTLLEQHGAIGASVSGSGSTVFGVFQDGQTRDQAWQALSSQNLGRLQGCRLLSSG